MTQNKQRSGLYLVLLCLIPLVVWLHFGVVSCLNKTSDNGASSTFVPSAQAVRLVALGYDQLIADCYWLAFVNYIGDTERREVDRSILADQYLDLITGLDPHFVQPYWYCAFIVGSEQKRPLRAQSIILRGIKSNPGNWYLPYIAGVNLYLFAHDETAASKYYQLASTFPDSPDWLRRQAVLLRAQIPSTIKEINTWSRIFSSEKSLLVRQKARQRLIALWSYVYSSSPRGASRDKAQLELKKLEDGL